ncbi:MAG: endo-1,4-beta-xylanase [Bacteroidota bacterium]
MLVRYLLPLTTILLLTSSCQEATDTQTTDQTNQPISLKSAFQDNFTVGAALGGEHINGTNTDAQELIIREFNTITPENVMKWTYIHPEPDSFFFDMADKYVALGQANNMHVVGHTLVWHSQIAEWMNEVQDSAVMAQYLTNHIQTIASRYKGKIHTWDVVNEAFNEDGSYRESNFYQVMGDSYLSLAFKLAAEADPTAKLVYNDYNLWKPEKREGVIQLVKKLQSEGIKIDGIGMQAHYSLVGPEVEEVENSIVAFAALGVEVMITELDVTALPNPWDLEGAEVSQNFEGSPFMNPYPDALPDSMQVQLADRYEDLFKVFLKHQDKISRITFWGVNDGHSWLNNWPIEGRTNYPLLFDRQYAIKPAYERVIALVNNHQAQN